jgi:hypothetical protein
MSGATLADQLVEVLVEAGVERARTNVRNIPRPAIVR